MQKPTPGAGTPAPKLSLTPSKNGASCACLVVVHNDKRNARKTAALMHEHCAYNLALVEPDSGGRLVNIPKHGATDPNSLLPRHIAELCLDNEKECRDFLTEQSRDDQRGRAGKARPDPVLPGDRRLLVEVLAARRRAAQQRH